MPLDVIRALEGTFIERAGIPAMLSNDEKALYYKVARGYTGRGKVLELGPWLGGSTFQICSGLEASGYPWSLTVVDRFRWSKIYASEYPEIPVAPLGSFLPVFEEHLSAFHDKLDIRAGDLGAISTLYPDEGDIELLFIDAPKSWRLLWQVMNHLAPRLMPGARIVFQDFLHITSRQIAWLLASIDGLSIEQTVETGTSVGFTVSNRLEALEGTVPDKMGNVATDALIGSCRRLWRQLPAARTPQLAVGLALDLLERDELDSACAILDEAVRGTSSEANVLDELARLTRKAVPELKAHLVEIAAYLRASIHPLEARRALRSKVEEATIVTTALDSMDRDEVLSALRALAKPRSAPAWAMRYAQVNGVDNELNFRQLFAPFQLGVSLNSASPLEGLNLRGGEAVVEIGAGLTMTGLMLRAMGAASCVCLVAEGTLDKRTFRNPETGAKERGGFTAGKLAEMVPGLHFAMDIEALESDSFDVALVYPPANRADLEKTLHDAWRILRPGGRLVVWWTNPRSWAGHGQAPQMVSEVRADSPEHRKLIDWAHLANIRRTVPSIGDVRVAVEENFFVTDTTRLFDDPAAVMRLSRRVRAAYPDLKTDDLLCRAVRLTAEKQ